MKKFLIGALTALMLIGYGALTEATDVERDDQCCRGYCYQNCDEDTSNGDYCGRYGCQR